MQSNVLEFHSCNGLNFGAALATVVGALVEVPGMLPLVAIINARCPQGA